MKWKNSEKHFFQMDLSIQLNCELKQQKTKKEIDREQTRAIFGVGITLKTVQHEVPVAVTT